MQQLDWTTLPPHPTIPPYGDLHTEYLYEAATGDHDYRGMLGEGGKCSVCGRAWQKSDNALYELIKDPEGKTIGRKPSDPTGTHGRPYRACDYDGSIHPEDLYKLFSSDAQLRVEVADWKYGWPHKIYIDGPRGLHAKFYTQHLVGIVSEEARTALCDLIATRTGVRYTVEQREGGPRLHYDAR